MLRIILFWLNQDIQLDPIFRSSTCRILTLTWLAFMFICQREFKLDVVMDIWYIQVRDPSFPQLINLGGLGYLGMGIRRL